MMHRILLLTALLMLSAPGAWAQSAATTEPPTESPAPTTLTDQVYQQAWDALKGQSLIVGGGYTQATLKFPQFRGDRGASPLVTDNGRISLLLQYETPERYFLEYPLQGGRAAFGYNFVFNYGQIAVNRQLQTSAFHGADVGTEVTGDYLVAAPFVFLRLGPLYPDRAVFWKFGFGVGGAVVRLDGDIRPFNGTHGEDKESVSSKGAVPALFTTATWELDIENWLVIFQSLFLSGTADHDHFTYEVYSLSLGYRVRF